MGVKKGKRLDGGAAEKMEKVMWEIRKKVMWEGREVQEREVKEGREDRKADER